MGLMDVSKIIPGSNKGVLFFFFGVKMIHSVFSWVEIGRFLIVTLIPIQYTYDV